MRANQARELTNKTLRSLYTSKSKEVSGLLYRIENKIRDAALKGGSDVEIIATSYNKIPSIGKCKIIDNLIFHELNQKGYSLKCEKEEDGYMSKLCINW